jgi:hypothetical protein
MKPMISTNIIRQFTSDAELLNILKDDNEILPIKEWVEKYINKISLNEILWILLRDNFLSEKDLRIFGIWCAREALKLIESPDIRSVIACNVSEQYANENATSEELENAYNEASFAYDDITYTVSDIANYVSDYASFYASLYAAQAAYAIAYINSSSAAYGAASAAASAAHYSKNEYNVFLNKELNELLTYF